MSGTAVDDALVAELARQRRGAGGARGAAALPADERGVLRGPSRPTSGRAATTCSGSASTRLVLVTRWRSRWRATSWSSWPRRCEAGSRRGRGRRQRALDRIFKRGGEQPDAARGPGAGAHGRGARAGPRDRAREGAAAEARARKAAARRRDRRRPGNVSPGPEPERERRPRLNLFAFPGHDVPFRPAGRRRARLDDVRLAVDLGRGRPTRRVRGQGARCKALARRWRDLDAYAGATTRRASARDLIRPQAWWMLGGSRSCWCSQALLLRPWWTRRRRASSRLRRRTLPRSSPRWDGLAASRPGEAASSSGIPSRRLDGPGVRTVAAIRWRPRGGLVVQADHRPRGLRAVVRHELAHIRNRDVDLAYFTVSLWHAFLAAAALPFALTLVTQSVDTVVGVTWRFLALAALVYLTRNAVLRSREIYADVRASVGERAFAAILRVLESLPRSAAPAGVACCACIPIRRSAPRSSPTRDRCSASSSWPPSEPEWRRRSRTRASSKCSAPSSTRVSTSASSPPDVRPGRDRRGGPRRLASRVRRPRGRPLRLPSGCCARAGGRVPRRPRAGAPARHVGT